MVVAADTTMVCQFSLRKSRILFTSFSVAGLVAGQNLVIAKAQCQHLTDDLRICATRKSTVFAQCDDTLIEIIW